jgi:hypothetical protein
VISWETKRNTNRRWYHETQKKHDSIHEIFCKEGIILDNDALLDDDDMTKRWWWMATPFNHQNRAKHLRSYLGYNRAVSITHFAIFNLNESCKSLMRLSNYKKNIPKLLKNLRKNVEMIRNARNINKTFETRENAYKLILFTFSSQNRNISEKVKKIC